MTENNQVSTVHDASALALIMNGGAFDRVMVLAKMMASGRATVPKHFQGNEADCAAVIMQALRWGADPFAVAQKTHIVNGNLGYEAQLVNAALQATGAVTSRAHYEYRGEGENLECRVGFVIAGETEIQWNTFLKMSKVTTRNSPLWKTNPDQQLGYLQVKNFARAYCPGAILGIYTIDELQDSVVPEREINPAPSAQPQEPAQPAALPLMPDENFKKNFATYEKAILTGKKTADDVIYGLSTKYTVSDDQVNALRSVVPPIQGEAEVVE